MRLRCGRFWCGGGCWRRGSSSGKGLSRGSRFADGGTRREVEHYGRDIVGRLGGCGDRGCFRRDGSFDGDIIGLVDDRILNDDGLWVESHGAMRPRWTIWMFRG